MSGSSSTITIDLDDDDDETQLVAWVNDLLTSLNFDVYYHRTHHFNDLQELIYTLL
jgi:hypothetical protein